MTATEQPILKKYFRYKTDVLLALHRLSSDQRASYNIGRNREYFVNEFLKVVIPKKLVVGHGEVWSKSGEKTGQLDTIIVRDDAPCLDFGGENAYLAEGVFAVLEVKSKLTNAKLKEAAITLDRVKNLLCRRQKCQLDTI